MLCFAAHDDFYMCSAQLISAVVMNIQQHCKHYWCNICVLESLRLLDHTADGHFQLVQHAWHQCEV